MAISLLISTGMLTAIGILLLFISTKTDTLVILIGGIFILAFPMAFLHFLTDTAKFSADRVLLTSIFRTRILKIEDIKTFGVYQQLKYNTMRSPIDPERVGEDKFPFLTHSIFLSLSEEFDLCSVFPKRNIILQFRRNEYEKIRQWMKKVSAQQCV